MIIRNIFVLILISFSIQSLCYSQALIGEVSKEDYRINKPQVIDQASQKPISNAIVSIPTEGKVDYTDEKGHFKITPTAGKPIILSVQKEGYRPFSLTLQDGTFQAGAIFEMQKASPLSLIVSSNLLHLGDNSYSQNSSGACLINAPCVGPTFSQQFKVDNITPKTKAYVTIGSVIGIDTIQAMKLGQNNLANSSSTPVEIFVNKNKIGELKINGDNQKIPIPTKILKPNSNNELTVKTGINKDSIKTDYDDIELMNLIVDISQ